MKVRLISMRADHVEENGIRRSREGFGSAILACLCRRNGTDACYKFKGLLLPPGPCRARCHCAWFRGQSAHEPIDLVQSGVGEVLRSTQRPMRCMLACTSSQISFLSTGSGTVHIPTSIHIWASSVSPARMSFSYSARSPAWWPSSS